MTSNPTTAEARLVSLGIKLPVPPEPFGVYAEAVQTGNLLFLTGMLPTEGRTAKFIGRVGAELDVAAGRQAAHLAAINGLAVARQHLGSLRLREHRSMYVSGPQHLRVRLFRRHRLSTAIGLGMRVITAGTATRMCGSPAATSHRRMRMRVGFQVTGTTRRAATSGSRVTGSAKVERW